MNHFQHIARLVVLMCVFVGRLISQVPTITSFSPTSAAAGATVTISGAGFSATLANNIVYFGEGRGTVTSANASALSVTVPTTASYAPISVSVIGTGKVAISKLRFDPKFAAGDVDASSLSLDQTISLGGQPWQASLADVNNDGKLDVLITRTYADPYASPTIAYLQNSSSSGNISFAPKIEVPSPTFPMKNISGGTDDTPLHPKKTISYDLDGDGKPDFIFVSQFGVSIVRDIGTPGNPNFQLWQQIFNPDMTGGSWEMVKGTIHNFALGLIFSALGGAGAGRTKAMGGTLPFNGGIGSMPSGFPDNHYVWVPDYRTNMSANDVAVGDFNGDGKPDIAIAYSGFTGDPYVRIGGRFRVFLNGGGTFNLASDLEILEPDFHNVLDIYSIATGDFDGNDTTDIVVSGNFDAYSRQGMVTVLINALGDGTSFLPTHNWPVDSRAERVVVADFDGDSKPDIAYQTMDDNKILVRRNTSPPGDLSFADPVTILQHNGYQTIQVTDFDGDGKPDLLWPCQGASGFKLARNTGTPGSISFAPLTHYITSIEFPNTIAVGDLNGDGKPDVVALKSLSDQMSILKNAIPAYSLSQSTVSVTTSVIAKSGTTPVSLQVKDASGSAMSTTGLTVSFGLSGTGTSSGSFGVTADIGGGVYTAIFNGTGVGTAKSVTASIGGIPVSSTLPTVRVAAGSFSASQSTVAISRPVVASGATAVLKFQAKDANGDTLTTGGLAGVTFFLAGAGTSSGTIGAVTDSGNGKYYTTLTATTAGTAKNINARLATDTVHTTLPTVTVIAGTFSLNNSVLSFSPNPILKYDTSTVTLQVKDGSSNNITTGGLDVKIEFFGNPRSISSTIGYLLPVVDNQNGTYSAKMVSFATGAKNIIASIWNGSSYQDVQSFPSAMTVNARPVSLSLSTVDWGGPDQTTLIVGGNEYFNLYARNDKGEAYTETNLAVQFTLAADGTSNGNALEAPHNDGGGVYRMQWHATTVGTARTLGATIAGSPVTSPLKTIAVVPAGPGITYPGFAQPAVPLDTIFTWLASSGATTYRVQVIADSLTGSVIIDTSGVTATSLHVTGLQNFRNYSWRVMAMNAGIESGIWNDRQFTTGLAAPLLIFPPDREPDIALPASFRWTPPNGAVTYRLQVATDTSFISVVFDQDTITSTIDTLDGFAAGTKYFWRVSATGGGGTSLFSQTRSFNTASVNNSLQTYFVKPGGDDNLAGTSWGTAFATLQKGLMTASAGSQIWVAAGTYKPTATLDRSISFQLKNGVAVYGGFAGTESAIGQRNWQVNPTILSGDIDADNSLANNSYHVVVGNTFATAALDGFTITGGNADGGQRGGGVYCSSGYPVLSNLIISNNKANDFGGGMYNVNGNPTVTNVTFTGNQSDDHGGGLHSERGTPILTNCTFTSNTAIDGAGMSNGTSFYPGTSNALFTNVVFKDNTSSHFGGGLYTEYAAPIFRNVLFHHNASASGGGVYDLQGNLTFTNVTFSNNVASSPLPSGGGGGMFVWLSSVVFKNVILWGNTSNQVYNGMNSKVTLSNSLVQDGIPSGGGFGIVNFNAGVDVDSGANMYANPLFANAASGDLKLTTGSPAIDAGTNSVVATVADPNGDPRIVGGTTDIGAYEYQSAASSAAVSVSTNDSLYSLGNTNVNLKFIGIAPGRTLLLFASRFQTGPESLAYSASPPSYSSPFRWVITKTGDFFSSATVSFSNVSTDSGIVGPSTVSIYRRSTSGSGPFSSLTTTYDVGGDKLSAEVSSFSEFILAGENTPLPVELTEFSAAADRLGAQLKWGTATETNNYGFEVERRIGGSKQAVDSSKQSTDSWRKIGFVGGAGTSNSPKAYQFADRNLAIGNYSYRLKQINRDGLFVYSKIIEVEVGRAPLVFTLSQNYPNPFNPTTSIEFTLPEDGKTAIKVYDILGREVATAFEGDAKAGYFQKVVFDASRFASGVYFARIEFKNKSLLKKMMLLK